jgi:hypothetical protein
MRIIVFRKEILDSYSLLETSADGCCCCLGVSHSYILNDALRGRDLHLGGKLNNKLWLIFRIDNVLWFELKSHHRLSLHYIKQSRTLS